MKLLTFQARRFSWKGFSKTIEEADEGPVNDGVEDAVVVFLHAEAKDQDPEEHKRVFKHSLKHVKWLANKRDFRRVALHSFTHLGAENAEPEFARAFIAELTERLEATDYEVKSTPFGWFCEWELAVYGESLAKVWKEV